MKRYVDQLIEDLHQITSNLELLSFEEADAEDKMDFSQVDKFERNEVTPVSQITGIQQAQLPPVEMLNEEQQALLATELEEMLYWFHFKLEFPHDYPNYLRYPFIRKLWGEEQVSVTDGTIHIDFCDYQEENCPFPCYCSICSDNDWEIKKEDGLQNKYAPVDLFADEDEDAPYIEDINGFYDDDGNKIDSSTVPVPELCRHCMSNVIVDWDENLLCLMNRYDQRKKTEFACGAFEKI